MSAADGVRDRDLWRVARWLGCSAGAVVCLALPALLLTHGSASAVPTAALIGARGPIPVAQFGSGLRGGVVTGSTPRRQLHFTFDDGPDAKLTPRLLDELDRAGFKATFFFSTSRFDPRQRRNAHAPALALEVARRGHQLGSHGYQHQRMARLGPAPLRAQLERSEALFAGVFGQRTFLFRPPFGSRNAALDQMLADAGYVTALWNIGMADWVERRPEDVAATFWRVLARNQEQTGERGGVVLMHDTHAWSVEAFKLIAASIAARNCELLASGEELYEVVDSLAPWVTPLSDATHATRQTELRRQAGPRCTPKADREAPPGSTGRRVKKE